MLLTLKVGPADHARGGRSAKLVDMLYERNDIAFERGQFRVRGDVVEVHPANLDEEAIRIEFFGDEIDRITRFDPLTGTRDRPAARRSRFIPAKQFVTPHDKMQRGACATIREELRRAHRRSSRSTGKLLEAQRSRCARSTTSR